MDDMPPLDEQQTLKDMAGLVGLTPEELGERPLDISVIIETARRVGHVLGSLEVEQADRMLRLGKHHALLMPGFRPGLFDGDVLLFVAAEEEPSAYTAPETWSAYVTGRIEVLHIKSRHAKMTEPIPLAHIGRVVERHLKMVEATRGNSHE
jgi:nonribosomal peptide synthetase DhbF